MGRVSAKQEVRQDARTEEPDFTPADIRAAERALDAAEAERRAAEARAKAGK
jgi:hypothetical protein